MEPNSYIKDFINNYALQQFIAWLKKYLKLFSFIIFPEVTTHSESRVVLGVKVDIQDIDNIWPLGCY